LLPCIDVDGAGGFEARALAEAAQSFNLATGPLLRTTLLRLGDEDHVLLVTMHHIVSDGWSIGVLVREMRALYPAYAEGTPPALAPLPVQYADFALWQRGWLEGEVLEQQLGYWRERLAGVPALELPTDRSRPAVANQRGATHAFVLPAALTQKLRQLGRQHNATLFMTLLAAFEALLHRYTGQKDFAVGTPIANRTDEKVEALIGCFINTLALRANVEGNPSFVELLGRVQKESLGGYAHQAVPFERLIDELQVERDLSRAPLCQAMFNLQNAPIEAQANKTPDAVAVECGDERLSYRELDERSNRVAHYLQSLGVGPDVRVGICVERSLELMVGLLGIVKAGGAYVPVDPSYPAERLGFLLDDAQVSVLLTQERLEERLPVQQAFMVLIDDDGAWATESAEPVTRRASPDDVVY